MQFRSMECIFFICCQLQSAWDKKRRKKANKFTSEKRSKKMREESRKKHVGRYYDKKLLVWGFCLWVITWIVWCFQGDQLWSGGGGAWTNRNTNTSAMRKCARNFFIILNWIVSIGDVFCLKFCAGTKTSCEVKILFLDIERGTNWDMLKFPRKFWWIIAYLSLYRIVKKVFFLWNNF